MRLLSVNVSRPKEVHHRGRTVLTGIFKEPVMARVMVRRTNLDGDGQADLSAHGGVHKAVYAYPFEHYEHWQRELGRPAFGFGQFGENLTVEGLVEEETWIGDVFRIGGAVVEVSQPRVPCFKLGIRMRDDTFPKKFLRSRKVGFYLRVSEEGGVGAGDEIELLRRGAGGVSVRDLVELAFFEPKDLDRLRKAVGLEALVPDWREPMAKRLMKLEAAAE